MELQFIFDETNYNALPCRSKSHHERSTDPSYANIENDVFCTTSFPQDTCQGDSGGPIFVKSGTDFIQYGVV
ncbi:hypothetical protein EAY04_21465, partial [Vibrio anguillarum]|uniref:trypsin-like serine protease n=1 Tax=Vibrio anguillarum TaxID=55601 RepID=UPI00188C5108